MARLLVGLFLIVMPVLELVVLIKVGQWIGPWRTVGLVVITAFTGLLIISQQSLTVFRQSLEAMSQGRPPVAQVLDGLFLMIAGALLLMPGFVTDALAVVLLVPPLRRAIGRWGIERILAHAQVGADDEPRSGRPGAHDAWDAGPREGPVIDGEFERLGERTPPSQRRNGARPH
jgi:UPF0716 protein FxsA